MAADLRRGEHIPKMQNNIGRKSMYCAVPCRAMPRGAPPGAAFCTFAQLPWIYARLNSTNSAAAKTPGGLEPPSLGTVIQYSTNCTTLTLWKFIFDTSFVILYSVLYYSILYYTILYYTILYYIYYTILYYTILYYTILYYTILYLLYHTIPYYTILVPLVSLCSTCQREKV